VCVCVGRCGGVMSAFMLEQIFERREEALLREQGAVSMGAEGDA